MTEEKREREREMDDLQSDGVERVRGKLKVGKWQVKSGRKESRETRSWSTRHRLPSCRSSTRLTRCLQTIEGIGIGITTRGGPLLLMIDIIPLIPLIVTRTTGNDQDATRRSLAAGIGTTSDETIEAGTGTGTVTLTLTLIEIARTRTSKSGLTLSISS